MKTKYTIKPLEWKALNKNIYSVKQAMYTYTIKKASNNQFFLFYYSGESDQDYCIGICDFLEKAKQAAQEDYEKRLKPCLNEVEE